MVDVLKLKYKVEAVDTNGARIDLSPFLISGAFGENEGELPAYLSISVYNEKIGNKWLHQILALGTPLYVFADGQEVFRGTIFDWTAQTDPLGSVEVEAYDNLVYLFKSEDDRYYRAGQRAIDVLTDIFRAWNIPIGEIQLPGVVLSKQVFRAMSVADMIESILKECKNKGAGEYIVRSIKGKVNVLKKMSNQDVYVFKYDENVVSLRNNLSISNLVTRVRVIGAEDEEGRAPVIVTLDGDTKYGILQKIEKAASDDSLADAKAHAKEILNESGKPKRKITVETVDVPFIRKGDKVKIVAGTVNGYCEVLSVEHDIGRKSMRMEVK